MTSISKITANQKNALKSTGPLTMEGKNNSSKNSLKHGILSKDIIIREEDPQELELLKNNLYESLTPTGYIEEILVEKIINSIWRLRRISQIENEMFQKKSYPGCQELSEAFKGYNGGYMKKISRYEAMLERNFYKALHELQRIQATRQGQNVLAPISVEINSSE